MKARIFLTAAAYLLTCTILMVLPVKKVMAGQWIRMNQLGYLPSSSKVAVLMSNEKISVDSFSIIDAYSGKTVYKSAPGDIRATGSLQNMDATFRLNFSALETEGAYRMEVNTSEGTRLTSDLFPISSHAYDGSADFVLNYMRQQRCGWNPFFRDSCHTKDAIIVYHPTKSGQHLDVRGGWHDASDCLQYTTTTANAIYQMMYAYESNPGSFTDFYKADGTPGSNGIPDIVDEIYWGLDWLDRMNPEKGELYNQLADDRDHVGMRVPSDDQADYGWGKGMERPVYFCTGEPQQRGKFMNETTGIASTAGKFASDFAYGARVLEPFYPEFSKKIAAKAADAFQVGLDNPGVCQTVSVVSPYIYEEGNWTDDMELGAMELFRSTGNRMYRSMAIHYGRQEQTTPWMGADTARHYQWYPFMNMGHVLLAKEQGAVGGEFVSFLREGIRKTYERGKDSPFLNGIPSIWCSNNLTTAMLTQCILYRQITGDKTYEEMEGALRDWLLGCNPWGISMIVELPKGGNFPRQPHSYIINYSMGNTTGGLVDGPVYDTIFGGLIGISTEGGTNYEEFQPGRMVYHDSTHDYSTNEPTMDGTASLTFPLSAYQKEGAQWRDSSLDSDKNVYYQGGIVQTDPSKKRISLVFTAADKCDGADSILSTLSEYGIKGSFFFTGEFFEKFPEVVQRIVKEGHYLGSHSYGHLLYAPWEDRNTLLVTKEEFQQDILKSYNLLQRAGVSPQKARYFMPPYEYYNSVISSWAKDMGLQIVNYTSGTYTNGDYTTPDMSSYYSSDFIMEKVLEFESTRENGLNGNIMLIHLGTEDSRTDKFYRRLPELITLLRGKGYEFVSLEEAVEG
ncbi:MAG: glycoside hydrolase family 9 protein [Bacteroidales bacterium]|nr:glycoside hydrolase family 9 protein [Bacteroidales bacterium]